MLSLQLISNWLTQKRLYLLVLLGLIDTLNQIHQFEKLTIF